MFGFFVYEYKLAESIKYYSCFVHKKTNRIMKKIDSNTSCLKLHTSDHEWPQVTADDHEQPRMTTSDKDDHERITCEKRKNIEMKKKAKKWTPYRHILCKLPAWTIPEVFARRPSSRNGPLANKHWESCRSGKGCMWCDDSVEETSNISDDISSSNH